MNRKELLLDLIRYKNPIEQTLQRLQKYEWDSSEIVMLTKKEIVEILDRCLQGEFEYSQIENWATSLEVREDIQLGEQEKEIIHILANPKLYGELNKEAISKIKIELEQ